MDNFDKALIDGDFNSHVDNTNDALGLAFTDIINSFGVKQIVTGPTRRFNHTLDLITSHGTELTDIDIIPQSDDVTDHFLVSCMLRITDINYMAPCYRPGRTIVPATKDISYRQSLKAARTEHIRKLIDNNQNNPRFLFSTVAKLTNNQTSPDLNIPSQFNSNDFMNFFTDKIDNIRNTNKCRFYSV